MSCLRGVPTLLALGLAGCFQSPLATAGVGGCDSCHGAGTTVGVRKTGTAGGSSTATKAGTSSGGSGASTIGTSSGTSSGSTSAGRSSSSQGGTSGGSATTSCQAPLLEMDARIYDISSSEPVSGAAVSAIGLDGIQIPGVSVNSVADGTFAMCLPGGKELGLEIQAPMYPTTYLENVQLSQPFTAFAGRDGIPLITSQFLSAMASVIAVGDPSTQAAIFAGVASASGTAPCYENASGWSFALDLADGGLLGDGGNVPAQPYYTNASGFPTAGLTGTSSNGAAVLFNVDVDYSNVLALQATNPDAGACPLQLATFQLTGRVYVATGALSIVELPTP